MNKYINEIVTNWGLNTNEHVLSAIIVLISLIAMLSVFWLILHIVSPRSSHFREMCFKVVIVTCAVLLVITTFVDVGGNVIKTESDILTQAEYRGRIQFPQNIDDYGLFSGFAGQTHIVVNVGDIVLIDFSGQLVAYVPTKTGDTWRLGYSGDRPFTTTLNYYGDAQESLQFDYVTLVTQYLDYTIDVYTIKPYQLRGVLGRGGV